MSHAYHNYETPISPLDSTRLIFEDDIRHFYDPSHRLADIPFEGLLQNVASTRQPAYAPGLGKLAGHEIILVESIHAMIDDGKTDQLPIKSERQTEIREAVSSYAGNIALSTVEAVDEIISDRKHRQDVMPHVKWSPLPADVVVAGKVLAATAHDGQSRRNGRPYYTHPDDVASILTIAWSKQMPEERSDELDRYLFLAYLHDGYEDTIDPAGHYLSASPVVVSPFVAQRVLQHYDPTVPEAVPRTLLYLTRTKDTAGHRMPYDAYTTRGIKYGQKLYIGTKAPDTQHNRNIEPEMIEPGDTKAQAKHRKREMYEAAALKLLHAANRYDEPFSLFISSVFAVTPAEVRTAGNRNYPLKIKDIAENLRSNFLKRQGAHTFLASESS